MDLDNYISPSKLTKQFDITSGTLRLWAEQGKIKFLRPNNGRRIYNIKDIERIFGVQHIESTKQTIIYARVSSHHQKEDLERQIELLQREFPNGKVIKDIGSGLNWKRPGFRSLLELIHKGSVKEIVVTYKDRLCRFGFELFEWVLQKASVKLLVFSKSNDTRDPTKELSEDLLSIVNIFVAKNNGLRAGQLRRLKQTNDKEKSVKGETISK
jgi:putative resolvase